MYSSIDTPDGTFANKAVCDYWMRRPRLTLSEIVSFAVGLNPNVTLDPYRFSLKQVAPNPDILNIWPSAADLSVRTPFGIGPADWAGRIDEAMKVVATLEHCCEPSELAGALPVRDWLAIFERAAVPLSAPMKYMQKTLPELPTDSPSSDEGESMPEVSADHPPSSDEGDSMPEVSADAVERERTSSTPEKTEADPPSPLAEHTRENYQRRMAALALLLAEKSRLYKRSERPNVSQISEAVEALVLEGVEAGILANDHAVGRSIFRQDIAEGLRLLQSDKSGV